MGKKRTVLFQTHNWERSCFFSMLGSFVYLHSYTQIRDRGSIMSPAGPNRVKTDLEKAGSGLYPAAGDIVIFKDHNGLPRFAVVIKVFGKNKVIIKAKHYNQIEIHIWGIVADLLNFVLGR